MVEVLLVVSILLIMIGIITGTLNPLALINRGKDARRKKDIARIKVAMEEYMNDKGCFPNEAKIAELSDVSNCGGDIFGPQLGVWPCDPNGSPYHLFVEDVGCPSWFKVIVYLENEKDRDIPDWWYDGSPGSYYVGDGSLSNADVNFGTSSTNVLWHERTFDSYCLTLPWNTDGCYRKKKGEDVGCEHPGDSCESDDEYDCFLDSACDEKCQVSCCSDGQPCD